MRLMKFAGRKIKIVLIKLISFYENKEIIIGVIFTVFILIAASFMILDVVQNKIRDKEHV